MTGNDSPSIEAAKATVITSQQCADKILQVIPQITHFLRDEVRKFEQPKLSLSQLRILCFLERYPKSSLSKIAEHLDVTKPTMSEAIERLVQQGFVARVNDPEERRRILLSLTAAGSEYQQQVYRTLLACIEQKLNSLSEEQSSQIIESLLLLENIFSNLGN